jgi:hypothetical protein
VGIVCLYGSSFPINYHIPLIPGLLACVILLSGMLPEGLERLYRFHKYEDESRLANFIKEHVPEDNHPLAISDAPLLYFISDCFPGVPFVNSNVQTTYYLSKHPFVLEEALNDNSLALVVFNDTEWSFDDPMLYHDPGAKCASQLLESKLKQLFYPVNDSGFPYKSWLRK